jgi:hypothetical protein
MERGDATIACNKPRDSGVIVWLNGNVSILFGGWE